MTEKYKLGFSVTVMREFLLPVFLSEQVLVPPPKFVFRVVSGPVVYTAIAVTNALRRSGRRFLSVAPGWNLPDNKYQAHSGTRPAHKSLLQSASRNH